MDEVCLFACCICGLLVSRISSNGWSLSLGVRWVVLDSWCGVLLSLGDVILDSFGEECYHLVR